MNTSAGRVTLEEHLSLLAHHHPSPLSNLCPSSLVHSFSGGGGEGRYACVQVPAVARQGETHPRGGGGLQGGGR